MLQEVGRVVAVEPAGAWVETVPSSLCGRCAARAGCGHGVMARAGQRRGLVLVRSGERLRVEDLQLNDEVTIELPESALLRGTLWVYLLPLLLGSGGAVLSESAAAWLGLAADGLAAMGFALGLMLAFAALRFAPSLLGERAHFEPRLADLHGRPAVLIARE